MKFQSSAIAWLASGCVMAAAAFFMFGVVGFRTVVGLLALFVLPGYALLSLTSLDVEERIFIALFAGLGLFSVFVWALNQVLPSLRLSIVVGWLALVVAGFFVLPILAKKARKEPPSQAQ